MDSREKLGAAIDWAKTEWDKPLECKVSDNPMVRAVFARMDRKILDETNAWATAPGRKLSSSERSHLYHCTHGVEPHGNRDAQRTYSHYRIYLIARGLVERYGYNRTRNPMGQDDSPEGRDESAGSILEKIGVHNGDREPLSERAINRITERIPDFD